MTEAIVAEGLTKRFGDVVALDGLSLSVKEGTVLGVLGPNGAGKTTTVRVLATLLRPDSGRAVVNGVDVLANPMAVRRQIGLSGQYAAVDEDLTAQENLEMIGRLYHLGWGAARKRAVELLERFDLADVAGRYVKGFSGGMRRRVDLACALVAKPSVLFLDEPTTGLDPRARVGLWEVITELVAQGSTLLLTTQYLEEADQLADRIAVIDHGRVIAEGTPDKLKYDLGGDRLELTVASASDVTPARDAIARIANGDITVDEEIHQLIVPVTNGPEALPAAIRLLDDANVTVIGTNVRRPSLDEVFFALTAKTPEVAAEPELAKEAVA
ncbi:ATP-binding cassette domain-containing protein [Lentzea flava]|uniref:Daunorubicin resistance protein DrrA family ABC transporter ATP-binding protein n=1 Tax=Lentzea flava TaxID=103732 RepID=A0ABQ2V8F2_9PSEU|nr:ATP-binding cassette domain-containing protein [Lentzea flava]MCP2203831.1 ABC-2 type transport system ATP-binding protein [Lentzea flava]GGU72044.1 daunorubicin resistance protein DrrA family ABC transporter ATP-binding protein [Lentzea flava]